MKVSCIKHPTKERLLVIHQWQLNYCDGNVTQAALLSFFEYWHNVKLELCAKKKAQGKNVTESALIQHHTEEELVIGILHIAKSEKTIRNAIRALAKMHAISILKNPDGRKGFDRTKHYRFHPEFVNAWLEAANGKITECTTTPDSKEQSAENQHSSSIGKTTESNRENYRVQTVNLPNANGKITEISPETTIEITTENTHTGPEKNSRKECAFFPLNDFEKAAWDWAQAHDFWKDRITTIERLRKNLETGKDFRRQFDKVNTPVQPSSHFSPPSSTTTGKGRFVFTMSECPFCDENGEFTYRDQNGKERKALCKHWNDTPEVGTKRGFEFIPPPNSTAIINPTPREQAPVKLGTVINRLRANNDDVPFR